MSWNWMNRRTMLRVWRVHPNRLRLKCMRRQTMTSLSKDTPMAVQALVSLGLMQPLIKRLTSSKLFTYVINILLSTNLRQHIRHQPHPTCILTVLIYKTFQITKQIMVRYGQLGGKWEGFEITSGMMQQCPHIYNIQQIFMGKGRIHSGCLYLKQNHTIVTCLKLYINNKRTSLHKSNKYPFIQYILTIYFFTCLIFNWLIGTVQQQLVLYNIAQNIMFAKNSRTTSPAKMHTHTSDRIRKIRDLVGKAIGQIKIQSKRSPSRSPVRMKSDESSQSETIQQVLANLKKGYLMIKHSQKINQPHDKFIYLSPDNRYLCWKSLTKEDQKRIEITAINKVIKAGAEFYIKSNQIKHISRCLVIVSAQRNLQLEATSEMEAEYFRYELYRVMKYWKGMSLNYKYSKE